MFKVLFVVLTLTSAAQATPKLHIKPGDPSQKKVAIAIYEYCRVFFNDQKVTKQDVQILIDNYIGNICKDGYFGGVLERLEGRVEFTFFADLNDEILQMDRKAPRVLPGVASNLAKAWKSPVVLSVRSMASTKSWRGIP